MTTKKKHKKLRSTLTLYLHRVADGDDSARDRLWHSLADRLLHVPLAPLTQSFEESEQTGITIKVHQIEQDEKLIVPVFTSEWQFKDWKTRNKHIDDSVALIGADLCKVLPEAAWLLVDSEAEAELLLSPEEIDKIADIGDHQMESEFGSETNIIELTTPLEEILDEARMAVADLEDAVSGEQESESQHTPNKGMKAWLGF